MNSLSVERKKCVVCFNSIYGRNSRLKAGDLRNLLKNCSLYLPPAVVAGTPLHKIRLGNHTDVVICSHCWDLLVELSHVGDQLAKFQKEMSNLTLAFSMAVLYRRSSPGSDSGEQSTIQLDISRLPPKWFRKSVPRNISALSEELPTTSGQGSVNTVNPGNPGNDDTIVEIDSNDSLPTEILDLAFENWSNNGSIDLDLLDPTLFEPQCDLLDVLEIPEQNENSETQQGNEIIGSSTTNKNINNNNNPHLINTPVENLMSLSELIETVSMPRIVIERLQLQGDKIRKKYSSMKKSCGKGSQNWKRGQFKKSNYGSSKDRKKGKTVQLSFRCQYCKKILSSKKTLTIHQRTHSVKKKLKCSTCEREYFSLSNLTRHKKIFHSGRKSCKCVLHNKFIQIVGRPYKCSFCKRRFKFKCKLKLHEIIHSKIVRDPHNCPVCEKSFKYRSQMKKHELVHSGGEPYNCSVCKSSFKYHSQMKQHEITHQEEERGPFKCSTCSKKFSQPSERIKHELIHKTEIRPYQCSICKKTFDVSNKLKHHVLIHSVGILKKFTKFGRQTKLVICPCQTKQTPIKCSVCK